MLVLSWTQKEALGQIEVAMDIVKVARKLELEEEKEDIDELVKKYKKYLTTEELRTLLVQEQDNAQPDASCDSEKQLSNQPILTATIKGILVQWGAYQFSWNYLRLMPIISGRY